MAGDGPLIGDADSAKALAMFDAGAPIVIDIAPSHLVAPKVDLSYQGQIRMTNDRPEGKVTVLARHYDATAAAIGALPGVGAQAAQSLALAKGLGKDEGDGALSWALAIDGDGMISVNGAPMGKLPGK